MLKKLIKVPILMTVCLGLSTLTMGLPGGSNVFSPTPVDVDELRKEFPTGLPESVYQTFHNGYLYQMAGKINAAQAEYDKLIHIPRKNGEEYDLSKDSKSLQRNLRLLPRR
jgi:hypothetical protein